MEYGQTTVPLRQFSGSKNTWVQDHRGEDQEQQEIRESRQRATDDVLWEGMSLMKQLCLEKEGSCLTASQPSSEPNNDVCHVDKVCNNNDKESAEISVCHESNNNDGVGFHDTDDRSVPCHTCMPITPTKIHIQKNTLLKYSTTLPHASAMSSRAASEGCQQVLEKNAPASYSDTNNNNRRMKTIPSTCLSVATSLKLGRMRSLPPLKSASFVSTSHNASFKSTSTFPVSAISNTDVSVTVTDVLPHYGLNVAPKKKDVLQRSPAGREGLANSQFGIDRLKRNKLLVQGYATSSSIRTKSNSTHAHPSSNHTRTVLYGPKEGGSPSTWACRLSLYPPTQLGESSTNLRKVVVHAAPMRCIAELMSNQFPHSLIFRCDIDELRDSEIRSNSRGTTNNFNVGEDKEEKNATTPSTQEPTENLVNRLPETDTENDIQKGPHMFENDEADDENGFITSNKLEMHPHSENKKNLVTIISTTVTKPAVRKHGQSDTKEGIKKYCATNEKNGFIALSYTKHLIWSLETLQFLPRSMQLFCTRHPLVKEGISIHNSRIPLDC